MAGKNFGQILDSWSELLDNHADQEKALKERFSANITSRSIPNVENTASVLSMNGQSRAYSFSIRRSGATVTTIINRYGSDLFVKWTLWWKPQWNLRVILGILGASLLLGIFSGAAVSSSPYAPPGAAVVSFLTTFIGSLIGITIVVGVLGFLLRGSIAGFLMTEFNLFHQDDAISLSFAVDHSLRQAADAVGITIKLRERTDFYTGKRSRLI